MKLDKTIAFNFGKTQALGWIGAEAPTEATIAMMATAVYYLLKVADTLDTSYRGHYDKIIDIVAKRTTDVAQLKHIIKGVAWLITAIESTMLVNGWIGRTDLAAPFLDGYLSGLALVSRDPEHELLQQAHWLAAVWAANE